MRARFVFIVVAILLVAGFAALNWGEMLRTTPLSFGLLIAEAPLGLIMLGALGLTLVLFLFSSAVQEARLMVDTHRHSKVLQTQRELAENAEASRFTGLQKQLEAHLRDNHQREAIAATELEKSMVQSQRELRNQLDQMNRNLTARFSEFEERLATRLGDRIAARPDVVVTESAPLHR
ncbi:MAG: hypothetical protein ABIU58_04965 [Ramlibacter sp.]